MGFLRQHFFKLLFSLIGLILAILLLTIGFLKTLLIVALTAIGFLVGFRIDSGRSVKSMIAKWANGGNSFDE